MRRLVTGEPTLQLHRDQYLRGALRHARVTQEELHAAIRGAGYGALAGIEAVVLETDGSFSIVPADRVGAALKELTDAQS